MGLFTPRPKREGFADAAARGLFSLETELAAALRGLAARILAPARDDIRAAAGDFVQLNPPAGTVPTVMLPSPADNPAEVVAVALEVAGSFRALSSGFLVNATAAAVFTEIGLYSFKSDGKRGWWVTPPAGGVPDADYGDIVVSLAGTLWAIDTAAVSNAKLATAAANTIKANATAGVASPGDLAIAAESVVGRTSGNLQAITSAVQTALIRAAGSVFWAAAAADQVLRRSGAGDLGFGTLVTGNIGNSQVTYAKVQDGTGFSLVGKATTGAGANADIVAGADTLCGKAGAGNVAFATMVTAQCGNNQITNAKRAQMAQRTWSGNSTLATADPADNSCQTMRETVSGGVLSQTTSQTATAAVTNLTTGAYTIPANTAEVGTAYVLEAQFYCGRGATATATSVIIEFLIGGAVARTLTIPINVAASAVRSGWARAWITFRTVGAGGTAMATLEADSDAPSGTAGTSMIFVNPTPAAAAPATSGIATTASVALELRMRLSAATATVFLHMLHSTYDKKR